MSLIHGAEPGQKQNKNPQADLSDLLKPNILHPKAGPTWPYLLKARFIVIGVLSHQGLDGDEHGRDALGWAPGRASPRTAKHSRGKGRG